MSENSIPETGPVDGLPADGKEDNETSGKTVEQPPKRRRRSGWDVPAPAASPLVVPTTSVPAAAAATAPTTAPAAPVLATPAPQEVNTNPASLLQQLLAQQVLQKTAPAPIVSKPGSRIYIGSINYDLKEPDVVSLFSAFGKILKAEMSLDNATGKSKGFCFIDYDDPASADAAQAMDGFELAGRKIKVGRPKQSVNQAASAAASQPAVTAAPALPTPTLGELGSAVGGPALLSALGIGAAAVNPVQQQAQLLLAQALMGQAPGATPNLSTPSAVPPSASSAAATLAALYTGKNTVRIRNIIKDLELKDLKPIFDAFGAILSIDYVEDPAGIIGTKTAYVVYQTRAITDAVVQALNNFNLAGLNLSIDQLPTNAAASTIVGVASSTVAPSAGMTVVLQNMITIEDTSDPELSDEIGEEAGKYGTLVDVKIDTSNQVDVQVILRYSDIAGANRAFGAMNGRAFANRKIVAVLR